MVDLPAAAANIFVAVGVNLTTFTTAPSPSFSKTAAILGVAADTMDATQPNRAAIMGLGQPGTPLQRSLMRWGITQIGQNNVSVIADNMPSLENLSALRWYDGELYLALWRNINTGLQFGYDPGYGIYRVLGNMPGSGQFNASSSLQHTGLYAPVTDFFHESPDVVWALTVDKPSGCHYLCKFHRLLNDEWHEVLRFVADTFSPARHITGRYEAGFGAFVVYYTTFFYVYRFAPGTDTAPVVIHTGNGVQPILGLSIPPLPVTSRPTPSAFPSHEAYTLPTQTVSVAPSVSPAGFGGVTFQQGDLIVLRTECPAGSACPATMDAYTTGGNYRSSVALPPQGLLNSATAYCSLPALDGQEWTYLTGQLTLSGDGSQLNWVCYLGVIGSNSMTNYLKGSSAVVMSLYGNSRLAWSTAFTFGLKGGLPRLAYSPSAGMNNSGWFVLGGSSDSYGNRSELRWVSQAQQQAGSRTNTLLSTSAYQSWTTLAQWRSGFYVGRTNNNPLSGEDAFGAATFWALQSTANVDLQTYFPTSPGLLQPRSYCTGPSSTVHSIVPDYYAMSLSSTVNPSFYVLVTTASGITSVLRYVSYCPSFCVSGGKGGRR